MIFTTKNNELAIFGKTIDDVRKKLIEFDDVIMQGGSFGKNSKQLITTEKLFKELSINDAKKIVDTLNSIKKGTNQSFESVDDYLTFLESKGKGYIKNYVKENQNQVYVTNDVIEASKKARAEQIAYNATIQQSTIAFKAASIAKRIFSTIGNMAAMWAISKAISAVADTVNELIHSEENLRQLASDLGSELSSNSSDIESYKKKIEELKSVISDSSSSFDEVSQARVDLMAIQDELIDKFGTEKGVIESITLAINDQTDALNELSRRKYFQKKTEFNEKTDGDKFADWLSFGNTDDDRIQSNMEKMVYKMENSFYELKTTGNEVLDDLIAKSYDLNIVDDMYGNGQHFQIYGTLEEIQNKLYGIQKLSQGFDLSTGFENSFTEISNDVDDALVKYQELYKQHVLFEKILTDNPDNYYDKQFDLINNAKEAYNEASKLGDPKKIEEASDEYAKTLQSAIDLAMQNNDFDVADYYKSMYPELQQMFAEWQFKLNFTPNTDGLQDRVKNALDGIDGVSDGTTSFSVEDIENFNPNIATQEQIEAYSELKNIAETLYGMTLPQLIAVLQELGLVQSESYQQLVDTFGQENVDKLSPEDLKIAYTIENAGNMTFEELQAEIQRLKEASDESPISPLTISDTVNQLNTQLKPAFDSLKSAYQEIFTDDGFALNSIDILSTCDSIKSKLDEMSELGLNVDYSSFEDFVRVLNNSESEAWEVENAFDSLASSITKAALSGAEDFETMKAALEDLGVSNSKMVAFDALTGNTEALDEAFSQANISMDDFIVNAKEGTVEATKAGNAFLEEKVGAENCAEALSILAFHKEVCNLQEMNTAGEVANLRTLAENAGYTGEVIQYLTELEQIYQEVASGTLNAFQIGAKVARAAILKTMIDGAASNINYKPKVDFSGATKAAGKAGKDAGKSYKEALKEELSDLEGVISGVTGRIDDQISSINEQKSTALDAIDAEKEALKEAKDAAVEALEAERDAKLEAIEVQISSKQKIIDGINDEIDAIREANEERQRQLDLQKAQYELERMQHQRTILQYSSEKGMHYVTDTSGIRDAKDAVEDIKTEIEIANKEKQIDLLEKEISLLNERKDEINEYYDDLIEKTEKYYDDQINALEKQRKETESYFESLTENLETQKSKFQELTELLEKAELSAKLKQLGIDEEALLAGSEEEFNKLKEAYLNIVYQLNAGNDDVLNALRELSGYDGTAPTVLSDSNTELDEMNGKLNESNTSIGNVNTSLGETVSTTSDVATNVSEMSSSLIEATAQVIEEQTAFNNLKLKIDEVIEAINQKTESIKEEQNATSIATSSEMADFLLLKEKILEVKETLESFGTPEEGLISDIASAIQSLNDIKLDDGLIEQFNNLKTAIDSVTSAISGGGGESSDSEGQSGGAGKGGGTRGKDSKGEGGGGGSLTDALTSMGETASEVIGEPDAEGDGTVIGEFGSLKTAVNNVTSAIGSGESEDGKGKGGGEARDKDGNGEDSGNLIGSIVNLGETTEETLGEPGGDGVIGRFEQFKEPIAEAAGHVHSISDGLDKIDGKKVECTITVNVNQKGNTYADGTVLGSMNLNNAAYTAQYGKALANGTGKYKGLPKLEKDALVSEYGQTEMTVLPNGNTIITDEPTLMDLPKGTVIFNETQTKQLMRNKIHVDGNTHGDNSTSNIPPATSREIKIIPFQPSDQMYDYIQKWNAYFGDTDNQIGKLIPNSIYERSQQMHNIANQITNGNITNKNQPNVHVGDIHITCPGVTSKEVAKQVGVELNHMFTGLHLDADQQIRMR